MNKKFTTLATSVFVALLVSAFAFTVVGCGGDPEAGAAGSAGSAGGPGTIYLSGSYPTAAIQHAIDTGAPLVFADLNNTGDPGTISVPAGRAIHLIGDLTLEDGSTLIAESGAFEFDTTATGNIVSGSGTTTIIAVDAEVVAKISGTKTLLVPAAVDPATGIIDPAAKVGDKAALLGNYTIVDTANVSATALDKAQFGVGQVDDLYIVGNLTDLTATSLPATNLIYATGTAKISKDASIDTLTGTAGVELAADLDGIVETKGALTISATQTGSGGIGAGSLTSTEAITSAGDVDVAGNFTLSGEGPKGVYTTTSTAKTKVGGTFTVLTVTLSNATADALTIGGNATIGAITSGNGGANELTFNGAENIIGVLTSANPGTVIKGTGPVTLAAAPVFTTILLVASTGGVIINADTATANAGDLTVVGENAKLILKDGKKITNGATGTVLIGKGSSSGNVISFAQGIIEAVGDLTFTDLADGTATITTGQAAGDGLVFYETATHKTDNNTIALKNNSASAAVYTFTADDNSDALTAITFTKGTNLPTLTIPGKVDGASDPTASLVADGKTEIVLGQGTDGGAIAIGFGNSTGGKLTINAGGKLSGITGASSLTPSTIAISNSAGSSQPTVGGTYTGSTISAAEANATITVGGTSLIITGAHDDNKLVKGVIFTGS